MAEKRMVQFQAQWRCIAFAEGAPLGSYKRGECMSVRWSLFADPEGGPMMARQASPKFVIQGQVGGVTWLNDLCEHPPLIIEAMHRQIIVRLLDPFTWLARCFLASEFVRNTREAKPPQPSYELRHNMWTHTY